MLLRLLHLPLRMLLLYMLLLLQRAGERPSSRHLPIPTLLGCMIWTAGRAAVTPMGYLHSCQAC